MVRSLTNTVHKPEPEAIETGTPVNAEAAIRHYILGPAATMLTVARMHNIKTCVEEVIGRRVPGDLIETGVWRGGATILMRAILKAWNVTDRHVWVADSFEGLPEPDPDKYPIEAQAHQSPWLSAVCKHFAVPIEDVQANFRIYGLLDDQVRFLKGWFKDTLPAAPLSQIAVMRLDGDYYESTIDALNGLYDRLSVGGYVIVDDYGEDAHTYCRRAVDEFRAARGIIDPMTSVDAKCIYWQRAG